jgi:hypothetical protein
MQNHSEFFSRSFIYGLIELVKLVTNIYFLFRFDHCLAEKNGKKVEWPEISRYSIFYRDYKILSPFILLNFLKILYSESACKTELENVIWLDLKLKEFRKSWMI